MTAAQKKQKRLQDQARQFWLQAKKHLEAGVQPGNRRGMASGIDRWKFSTGQVGGPTNPQPGGVSIQAGRSVSDADVDKFIAQMGGNPYAPKGKKGKKAKATPAANMRMQQLLQQNGMAPQQGQEQDNSPRALLAKLSEEYQRKTDEANAANEARYQEVKGSNNELYGRVMGEVDNWGGVQHQLNEERAKESLSEQAAYLESRGLTNSTVMPSFQARSDRDLALTQQDLSEKKSARKLGYDIDLTNNANNFIERRTDKAPDSSQFAALVAKLGEAEAYRKGREEAAAKSKKSRKSAPRIPYLPTGGVSAGQAAQMAQQMTGAFRMPQQGYAMPAYGGGQQYPANYEQQPVPQQGMTPAQYRKLQEQFAQQQRINSRLAGGYQQGDASRAVGAGMQRKRDKQWEQVEQEEANKQWMRDQAANVMRMGQQGYQAMNNLRYESQRNAALGQLNAGIGYASNVAGNIGQRLTAAQQAYQQQRLMQNRANEDQAWRFQTNAFGPTPESQRDSFDPIYQVGLFR